MVERNVYNHDDTFGDYPAVKIYRSALDGSDVKLIFEAPTTDGIPDNIDNIKTDGEILFYRHRTYKDFQNQFNPKGSRGSSKMRIVDLSTGEYLDLGE